MNKNLFQQLQEKRSKMKEFASAAFNKKWINEQEYAAIAEKIDNDVLTIGVIGQMKSGKSTFLNSLLFGREILPAATTPMTAALSVITYGEEERIEAEFYNNDEWKEMQMLANCDITDANGDKNRESKIKAAKELVKNSEKISSTIPSLLGSTKKRSPFESYRLCRSRRKVRIHYQICHDFSSYRMAKRRENSGYAWL